MIYLLLLLALILRFILIPLPAFGTDMGCWIGWSTHILNVGPANFYSTTWSDYLPTYLYVLWFLGFLHSKISLLPYETLLKLPAVFSDIGIGFLIFRIVKKELKHNVYALISASLYLFNPFVLFNGSVWGQVDSVFTFGLLLSVYITAFIEKHKKVWTKYVGWSLLGALLVFKPQTLFFIPFLLVKNFYNKNWQEIIKSLSILSLTTVLISLPFFPNNPIGGPINQVRNSANTYPNTTVNAMNFWAIFGNWKPDTQLFIGLSKLHWGLILMVFGMLFAWKIRVGGFNKKHSVKTFTLFLALSIVAISYFMLPTRVHERWLFTFFPFFLIACALINDKRLWISYILLSVIHFFNLYYAYTYYHDNFLKIPGVTNFLGQYFGSFGLISAVVYVYILYFGMAVAPKHDFNQILKHSTKRDRISKKRTHTKSKQKVDIFWNFFD